MLTILPLKIAPFLIAIITETIKLKSAQKCRARLLISK